MVEPGGQCLHPDHVDLGVNLLRKGGVRSSAVALIAMANEIEIPIPEYVNQ